MRAPVSGSPCVSVTRPSTQHGSPLTPSAMSPPIGISGESSTKNGPKTVDSVRLRVVRRVDRDGQHREPEDVGEQDELLAAVVGDVPDAGQELDRLRPLLLGQPDVAGERVQVGDERLQDLARARIGRLVEARAHLVGDQAFTIAAVLDGVTQVLHLSPRWPSWTVVAACTSRGRYVNSIIGGLAIGFAYGSADAPLLPDRRRGGLDHARGAAAAHVPAAAVGAAAGAGARARRGAAGAARARRRADRGRAACSPSARGGCSRTPTRPPRPCAPSGRACAGISQRDRGRDGRAVAAGRPAGVDARERARRRGDGRGRAGRRGARRRRPRRHRRRADPPRPRRPRGRAGSERQAARRAARAGDRGRGPRAAGRRAGASGTRRRRSERVDLAALARRRPDRPRPRERPGPARARRRRLALGRRRPRPRPRDGLDHDRPGAGAGRRGRGDHAARRWPPSPGAAWSRCRCASTARRSRPRSSGARAPPPRCCAASCASRSRRRSRTSSAPTAPAAAAPILE